MIKDVNDRMLTKWFVACADSAKDLNVTNLHGDVSPSG